MQFLKKSEVFYIIFLIISIGIIRIDYSYSQVHEPDRWNESVSLHERLNEFDRVLIKGTPKNKVLNFLGQPDNKERNAFFGYELWHYNNIFIQNENIGSFGIVFRNDLISDVNDELFPPEWMGWKQIMQVVFFPAYFLLAIPAALFLTVPVAFFCLVGIYILTGWLRFFCVYLLAGYISMIIPWAALTLRK